MSKHFETAERTKVKIMRLSSKSLFEYEVNSITATNNELIESIDIKKYN
jgi:hypothetical protein